MKTANEAMAEILEDKDLNLTGINHNMYAAKIVITEEINGTGSYKSETHSPKTPPLVRRIQESINGIKERPISFGRNERNKDTIRKERDHFINKTHRRRKFWIK
jgi:hypothetical protein